MVQQKRAFGMSIVLILDKQVGLAIGLHVKLLFSHSQEWQIAQIKLPLVVHFRIALVCKYGLRCVLVKCCEFAFILLGGA